MFKLLDQKRNGNTTKNGPKMGKAGHIHLKSQVEGRKVICGVREHTIKRVTDDPTEITCKKCLLNVTKLGLAEFGSIRRSRNIG